MGVLNTPGVSTDSERLGFVVGLAAEARIAARFGFPVLAGGGTPEGAAEAASRLIADGATALISFGLAGGLDPALSPGAVVIAEAVIAGGQRFLCDKAISARFGGTTGHTVLAESTIVVEASAKRALFVATGAHAVDLESGSVALAACRHAVPFAVVRAICDPAARDLPLAAMVALDRQGAIGLLAVLRSVLARPGQIRDLLAVARDAAKARRSLVGLVR